MIYLIRHAQSRYNKAQQLIKEKHGENYQETQEYLIQKFNKKYLDVEITEHGQSQAEEARQKMKDIQIDLVLVSPLRRALHTCDIIFKNHKSQPKILVQSQFREIMESSNDIGCFTKQSRDKYKNMDFSNLADIDNWYVETMYEQKDRNYINQKIKILQGQEKRQACIQATLNVMKQSWQQRSKNHQISQILKKRVLPRFQIQKQIIKQKLKDYKSIAIVAHSQCIKMYVGYKIKNCQIYPLSQQKLEM